MTPQEWSCRAVALLVAWDLVLALCALAGHALDFQFWPGVMGWGLIGLILMLRDSDDAPLPAGEYVDVIGALRMLWWAAQWPMRLFKT